MDGIGRRRVSRETSPDRARVDFSAERKGMVRALTRRVQIVYYLSRNGQLEHPHFMELPQLPNQQLRLKDVIERLTILRGKGMPSLYSWSCKRSYKNGYVWNDLSENDVIYPADGAEYVLKGSKIVPGCSSERFQQLRLSNRAPKPLPTRTQIEPEYEDGTEEDEEEEIEEEQENDTGKPRSLTAGDGTRCSRGVSTDEIAHVAKKPTSTKPRGSNHQTEIPVDDGSPPSSSSSDPALEPSGLTRNSVFLNLIACGSGASVKGRKSEGKLQKGVVGRRAATRASGVEYEEADVRFMSENPRFGNLQGEDKEYFSGSIVLEATRRAAPAVEPAGRLKKSSSYNEERCSKVIGIGEECLVVGEEKGGVKGKCIPGRKRTSSKRQQQQANK